MLLRYRSNICFILLCFTFHYGKSDSFLYRPCYDVEMDNRMPQSVDNLVSLSEKYEREHGFTSYDDIAANILKRYRIDGITFDPQTSQELHWAPREDEESDKEDVLEKVFVGGTSTKIEEIFTPREECSLHMMTSHSTDLYPRKEVDDFWNDNSRQKRAAKSYYSKSSSSKTSSDEIADHPIENGVLYSVQGPVAGGTLLAGIAAIENNSPVQIRNIYNDASYMPNEMLTKELYPLHASTIAGDIGQSAIVLGLKNASPLQNFKIGPFGLFANCTACARQFSLENEEYSYLTRAEIMAGLDSLLIYYGLKTSSFNNKQFTLSQLLRMYYSEHGIPGFPEVRACNRMRLYDRLDMAEIKDQALNFMYAYSHKFNGLKPLIENNEFSMIEDKFMEIRDIVWNEFDRFVRNYNYEDYEDCSVPVVALANIGDTKCENQVDLIVVYGRDGSSSEFVARKEIISTIAQRIGVGYSRSRIGLIDGKTGSWLYPMTNTSNIADWSCNFTTDNSNTGSGGSDMEAVLDALTVYFNQFYENRTWELDKAEGHSQVVLWNVPSTLPVDEKEFEKLLENFKYRFMDVYFLLAGKSKGPYTFMLEDEDNDFFLTTSALTDPEDIVGKIVKRICFVPSVLIYSACDKRNKTYSEYRETSNIYNGYVSPNFTNYILVSPIYFLYSGYIQFKIDGNVKVCATRHSFIDNEYQVSDEEDCKDSSSLTFEFRDLCDRYLSTCDPIYMSVEAIAGTLQQCSDKECEFPDQVKFKIQHEGMTCGGMSISSWLPFLLMGLLVFLSKI